MHAKSWVFRNLVTAPPLSPALSLEIKKSQRRLPSHPVLPPQTLQRGRMVPLRCRETGNANLIQSIHCLHLPPSRTHSFEKVPPSRMHSFEKVPSISELFVRTPSPSSGVVRWEIRCTGPMLCAGYGRRRDGCELGGAPPFHLPAARPAATAFRLGGGLLDVSASADSKRSIERWGGFC